ncbi:hypothetical protein NSK_003762 [Nannochloropsis salina CCMP1776]|uniref:Uncharacterized protein n=1 Tax=Nannochloropsis salina CCMP1776 TaxID=1027361 RepID=A0A4D9CZZ1_9STRA|nr:hypothetical protein NSK_003762 [Nannochloropsis salina CCMP1776]|eukprot:TFJ84730.1 hypothetical protein NSK_003762 [Nannochloropsis salina CCMP1776]
MWEIVDKEMCVEGGRERDELKEEEEAALAILKEGGREEEKEEGNTVPAGNGIFENTESTMSVGVGRGTEGGGEEESEGGEEGGPAPGEEGGEEGLEPVAAGEVEEGGEEGGVERNCCYGMWMRMRRRRLRC